MRQKRINPLAEILRQKRLTSGLSQRDVAVKLGYTTPQFVSNWERGVSCPPIKVLKRLSEFYEVSHDELFEAILNWTLQKATEDLTRKFYGSKYKSTKPQA